MKSARLPVCVLPAPASSLTAHAGLAGAPVLATTLVDDAIACVRSLPWARPVRATDEDLARIVSQAMRENDAAAIAVASGSLGLPPSRLEAARAALAHVDAVLGPTDEGGLYLVAVRRCPRGLLTGIPWNSSEACAIARDRLVRRGMSTFVLDPWFRVERDPGLRRAQSLLRTGIVAATSTRRLIAPRIAAAVTTRERRSASPACLAALARVPGLADVVLVRGADATRWLEQVDADVVWLVDGNAVVPSWADGCIMRALLDPEVVAGVFPPGPVARDSWPSHAPGELTGGRRGGAGEAEDFAPAGHGLFIRREALLAVGGLGNAPHVTDDLVRRLRGLGRLARVVAPAAVHVATERDDERAPLGDTSSAWLAVAG